MSKVLEKTVSFLFYPVIAYNEFFEKNFSDYPEKLKKAFQEPACSIITAIFTVILLPFTFLPALYGFFVLWVMYLATKTIMGVFYIDEPPLKHILIGLLLVLSVPGFIFLLYKKDDINPKSNSDSK